MKSICALSVAGVLTTLLNLARVKVRLRSVRFPELLDEVTMHANPVLCALVATSMITACKGGGSKSDAAMQSADAAVAADATLYDMHSPELDMSVIDMFVALDAADASDATLIVAMDASNDVNTFADAVPDATMVTPDAALDGTVVTHDAEVDAGGDGGPSAYEVAYAAAITSCEAQCTAMHDCYPDDVNLEECNSICPTNLESTVTAVEGHAATEEQGAACFDAWTALSTCVATAGCEGILAYFGMEGDYPCQSETHETSAVCTF